MANNRYTKKYVVGLSLLANSFFDPDCGANLFKGSPVYEFNHKPTNRIVAAVKSGRLKDLRGNILEEGTAVQEVPVVDPNMVAKEVDARVSQIEKELKEKYEKEYAAKLEEAKTQMVPQADAESTVDKADEVKAPVVETKAKAKDKAQKAE